MTQEDEERWIADPRDLTFWEFLEAEERMRQDFTTAQQQYDNQRAMGIQALRELRGQQQSFPGAVFGRLGR